MARPSKFQEEFIPQAEKLCKLGATDMEVADFFEVDVRTLYRWKAENEAFCQSLKVGKELADNRVERALYERATGFAFVEQQAIKVKTGNGAEEKVEIVEVERQQPPDTTACIFWLKNRKSAEWRDKVETEHSGTLQIGRVTREIVRPAQ